MKSISLTLQHMHNELRVGGSGGGSVTVASAVIVVLLSEVPIVQPNSPMLACHPM